LTIFISELTQGGLKFDQTTTSVHNKWQIVLKDKDKPYKMYCTFVIRLCYLNFLTVFENHMLMFKSTPWDVIYY